MSDEERAFALEIDGDHLGDDDTDASLIKFEGSDELNGLIDDRPLTRLPERIYFEANTDTLLKVKKLVLKDAPLPALFRLSARPGPLLVSAAARATLEKAGIRGVRFVQLKHVF